MFDSSFFWSEVEYETKNNMTQQSTISNTFRKHDYLKKRSIIEKVLEQIKRRTNIKH